MPPSGLVALLARSQYSAGYATSQGHIAACASVLIPVVLSCRDTWEVLYAAGMTGLDLPLPLLESSLSIAPDDLRNVPGGK